MNILASLLGVVGGGLNSALGLITSNMKEGFQAAIKFHKEGIAFARDAGLSARQAQAYTDVLIQRTQVLANKYGVSAEAIAQVQRGLSEATGKQLMLNNAQTEGFVQLNKMMGSQATSKFTEEIMNGMGGQIGTVQNAMAKVYATATKQGLNAKKLTDKVAQNLGMANRLSFRNGIDGITRMAALSEKLSINMSSVETAAGQFMDLDKAIQNSAQMQMLGGSAAANFGNPLTAAYEANYDPEAFAERMSKSLGSYATFDAKKGVASINGMNMDFVRNIAQTMGISVEEASRMAKKQAEVKYKENAFGSQLDRIAGGDEARRNYILNNSQIDTATGKLQVQGKNIDDISDKDWKQMMEFEGMSDKEILEKQATTLTSIDEHISGASATVVASFAKGIDQYLPDIGKKIQTLGNYLSSYAEQWGEDTGKVVGKAMDWINQNGPAIKSVADSILGAMTKVFDFLSGGSLYRMLAAVIGYKALKSVLGGSFGGASGARAAARGIGNAAKVGGRAIKSIWKGPAQVIKGAFSEIKTAKNGMLGSAYKFRRNTLGMSRFKAARQAIKVTGGLGQFKNTLKLAKSGGIGIAGALGNVAVDSLVASGKIKKGGVGHYAGKMASTAAEYAAFGSMLGPIGTGIGAAVGAVKGAYDTWKSLPENADKDFIDYAKSVGQGMLDAGKNAFNWVKEKVGPALSAVNKEVQDRGGYLSVAFHAITAPIRFFISTLEGIAKFIAHPVDTIKNIWNKLTSWLSGDNVLGKLFNKAVDAIIGSKENHAQGGVVGGKSYSGDKVLAGLNSGEAVVTPRQFHTLFNMAETIIKAKPVGEAEYIYRPNGSSTSNVNGNTITVKDFNINLTGTLRLDMGNASRNINSNELLNNQEFINALRDIVKDKINRDMNGGRFMNDLAARRGQVSSSSIIGR